MKWPFHKPSKLKPEIRTLEEEVRKERGSLAVNVVNFERQTFDLDEMIKRTHALLDKGRV